MGAWRSVVVSPTVIEVGDEEAKKHASSRQHQITRPGTSGSHLVAR